MLEIRLRQLERTSLTSKNIMRKEMLVLLKRNSEELYFHSNCGHLFMYPVKKTGPSWPDIVP